MNVPRPSLPIWAMRTSLVPAIIILVNAVAEPTVSDISRPLLHAQAPPVSQSSEAQPPGRALPFSSHFVFKLSVFLLWFILLNWVAEISFLEPEKSNICRSKTNVSVKACGSLLNCGG